MSRIIPFKRVRITNDGRSCSSDCAHRHIRLDQHGGIVTCADCSAMLTPFWALSMLAEQYRFALAQIERLNDRLSLAEARILELSANLDAIDAQERATKQAPTEP